MVVVTELQNTLWGVVLEAGTGDSKKVEHKSERMLHVTMAALDTSAECCEFVPIVFESSDTNKYIMCTLSKSHQLQQPLQLMINAGETVSFSLNCLKGKVNLTGYYLNEMPMSDECDHEHGQEVMPGKHDALFYEQDDDDEGSESDEEDEDEDDFGEDDSDDDEEDDDEDDDDVEEDEEDEDEDEEGEKANGKRKLDSKPSNGIHKKLKEDKKEKADDKPPKLVPNKEVKNESQKKEGQEKTLPGGVVVKELRDGKGPEAKKGKFVHVYYTGRLKQNGKQFDACVSGKPFKFRLGAGEVIKGWDVGVEGMKVGSKRTLTIPPNMGYGSRRMGNDIPANSTLVFDVELKAVS